MRCEIRKTHAKGVPIQRQNIPEKSIQVQLINPTGHLEAFPVRKDGSLTGALQHILHDPKLIHVTDTWLEFSGWEIVGEDEARHYQTWLVIVRDLPTLPL